MSECHHTKYDGSWWETDIKGLALARVCDKCRGERLKGYRPEILDEGQQLAAFGKVLVAEPTYRHVEDHEQVESDY